MRMNVPFLDLQGVDLRRARIQGLSAVPSLVAADAGRIWFNTSTTKMQAWNGSAAENLTNLVESITATGALHAAAPDASKNVALTIDAASGSGPGTMSAAHYNLVSGAVSTNTPSTLMLRDSSGNVAFGTATGNLTGTASNASQLGNQNPSYYTNFANSTGQRAALSAISDFMAQVLTARLDQLATPTAPVALGSQRLTGMSDPLNPQDGATKNYVDSVATGLDTKGSVRAATIAALPANTYSNGTSGQGATLTATANGVISAVDGYTPAVNDRLLVKNEASQANNGIYVVTSVGSASTPWVLTRATDSDVSTELSPGTFTFIEAGTTQAGSGWVLNSPTNPTVVGSTALPWAQFSSGASYVQGNGINISGTSISAVGTANRIAVTASGIDISSAYVGQTSITTLGVIGTGTWQGTTVGVAYGGTGATTAAGARSNLGVPGKYAAALPAIPAGGNTTVTHGLGTTDIGVYFIDQSTMELVYADVTGITTTQLTVTVGNAIANGAWRIVAIG